ncbi:hypothetical protein [uncultured Mediterranean phage uvMED]|nr:hypothetical protein [uncultured Mediterranean phage uvMED]
MTRNTTKSKDLVELKLAVINYHSGDSLTYLRESIARDACYTSNNGIQYKETQISENTNSLKDLRETFSGAEVTHVQMSKLAFVIKEQKKELKELTDRHQADLKAFKKLVGKEWTQNPKKSGSKNKLAELNEIDALLEAKS